MYAGIFQRQLVLSKVRKHSKSFFGVFNLLVKRNIKSKNNSFF